MRVLITGGASGIGLATAHRLKQAGVDLILWDIDETALKAAAQTLGVDSALVDCTRYDQIKTALAAVNTLDAVIHCAGILHTGLFEATAPATHARTIDVNLTGTLHMAHAVLPYLRQSKGSLILIASVSGFYGIPEFASYAASKAAVLNVAQGLRVELAGSGVHIGVVVPNLVDTPMLSAENRQHASLTNAQSPFLKVYTADDIAQTIERGLKRQQFMIFPDWRSYLVYFVSRYAAWMGHWLTRRTWEQSKRG
jgi:3-dehydrosphinganine reductase